jgi:Tol biopolymer transport system component
MGLAPGARVGPYEILAPLGAGGMGEVWRARDPRLGRDVAVKVLPARVAGDADRLQRFEQEARATGALNHPNVLAVHDFGTHDGAPYLVTELLEGMTLRERLADGPLPVRKALDLAGQVARGLAAAHEQGIVHRDLKPENLFVTRDGRVKILDFGLAKALGGEAGGDDSTLAATEPGAVLGTAGYMAPEQVRGRPADPRSDIFAFGAVLYELLAGRRAFPGESAIDRAHAILNQEPPPLPAEVPAAVQRLALRCLEKAPDERFGTARDLGFALEAVAAPSDSGVSGRGLASPGAASPAAAAPRRLRRVLAATVVLLTLAAGIAIGRWLGRAPGRAPAGAPAVAASQPARGPVPVKLRRLTHQPGGEWWPAVAPDGTWFVYARTNGAHSDIYRQRVGGEQAQNLTADCAEDDTHPAISPDGERLAFRSDRDGGGIFIMGATGESVRRVTDFGYHPAWSPDGKELAVSTGQIGNLALGASSTIEIVRVDTGARRSLRATGAERETVAQPAWSPDGRWIAYHAVYTTRGGARALSVAPSAGGEERRLFTTGPATGTPTWAPDSRAVYFATNASGVMNVWRIGFDPASGRPLGDAEPVTTGVGLASLRPTLSRDGRLMLFTAYTRSSNLARVPFDPGRGVVTGPVEPLTRGANEFVMGDVSPDGQWLAFSSGWSAETPEDVYVMRSDGTGLRQLTSDTFRDRRPRFTRDGKRIVFFTNRDGRYATYVIAPDGSGLTRLTRPARADELGYFHNMVPSPVDDRVAVAGPNRKAYVTALARVHEVGDPEALPPLSAAGDMFVPFEWSRDGKLLYGGRNFDDDAPVAVYDFAAQRFETLDVKGGTLPLRDGRRLLVLYRGRLTLYDRATRKSTPVLALEPAAIDGDRILSPDERWLYFSVRSTEADVWLAELK